MSSMQCEKTTIYSLVTISKRTGRFRQDRPQVTGCEETSVEDDVITEQFSASLSNVNPTYSIPELGQKYN